MPYPCTLAGWAACGRLLPIWTPHALRLCYLHNKFQQGKERTTKAARDEANSSKTSEAKQSKDVFKPKMTSPVTQLMASHVTAAAHGDSVPSVPSVPNHEPLTQSQDGSQTRLSFEETSNPGEAVDQKSSLEGEGQELPQGRPEEQSPEDDSEGHD
jgi:hypothetical protein